MHLWWRRTVILTGKRLVIIVTLLVGIWISVSTYTQNEKLLFQHLNNTLLFEHYFIIGNASKSIGCPFFLIPFSIGTDVMDTWWNGISIKSNFFIGQINRGHLISTYICQSLSKDWNHQPCYVPTTIILGLNYIGLFMSKKAKCEWLSFQCTNRKYEEFLYQIVPLGNSKLFNNAEDR